MSKRMEPKRGGGSESQGEQGRYDGYEPNRKGSEPKQEGEWVSLGKLKKIFFQKTRARGNWGRKSFFLQIILIRR